MPEFAFHVQGEDRILVTGPQKNITRTRKDFEVFNDHLDSTVNEVLLPQTHSSDFIKWMSELLDYNPNYQQISVVNNFLTNENFYIRIEDDKFKFLRKYSDFIERTWGYNSNYEHIGVFVDNDSEEKLYELENKFITLGKVKEELETSFTKKLTLTRLLNEKCEFLKQDLKYFISSSHHTSKMGHSFLNDAHNTEILIQLEDLSHIFETIHGFFERKRIYYDKYKRIKDKLLKEKLLPESKEETLHNPQAALEELVSGIKKYNINLIQFLENHELAISVEVKITKLIRDINNILSNKCD